MIERTHVLAMLAALFVLTAVAGCGEGDDDLPKSTDGTYAVDDAPAGGDETTGADGADQTGGGERGPTGGDGGGALRPPTGGGTLPPPTGGGASGGVPVEPESAGRVAFAGLTAPVPDAWSMEPPSSSFRAVQMTVPGEREAGDAEFVVFVGIGGSVADNVQRWEGQFTDEDGNPVDAEIDERTVSDLRVTTAILSGEYSGGMNPRDYGEDKMMIQSIVEKPGGEKVFIRLLGPRETVQASREAFFGVIDGIEPAS